MKKTFPIKLEVEEIALGAVLRKLNEMPGIAKLDLDLGQGGQGPGRKQIEQEVQTAAMGQANRQPAVLQFLMNGPKSISEISALIGGSKTRAYGLMSQLQKKGLSKAAGKGMHELTPTALTQLNAATKRLPPAALKHGPKGRASPGSGNIVLRSILGTGPKTPAELRELAASKGISQKSMSGVLERAKKGGLIKKNGDNVYELTAKGQKIELPAGMAANG